MCAKAYDQQQQQLRQTHRHYRLLLLYVVCCCLCPLLGGIPCFGNIMENQFVFGASTGRMSIYLVRVACNQRVADHNIYIESNRF